MSVPLGRVLGRISRIARDRLDDPGKLTPVQRSWLLRDFREDLDDQIEDAEERPVPDVTGDAMPASSPLGVARRKDG
jgi:hypothetical protein